LPLAALWAARRHAKAPLAVALPPFVLGFLLLAVVRSVGDLGIANATGAFGVLGEETWNQILRMVATAATWLMVVALAALGMNTKLRDLRGLGMKPFLVGFATALSVGFVAWSLIVTSSWGAFG
jgi:uncharacterized membrane protein YadS